MLMRELFFQVFRYSLVGIFSNIVAYGIYLVIVFLGVNPFLSMTLVYVLACTIAFAGNRGWTFRSSVSLRKSSRRYVIAQLIGYLTNLLMLSILYLFLGTPHQIAQLIGIIFVAIELFLLNKYFVFA